MSSSASAFIGRFPASGRALGRVVPGHCHGGDGVDGGVHGVGLQGCPLRVVVLGLEKHVDVNPTFETTHGDDK